MTNNRVFTLLLLNMLCWGTYSACLSDENYFQVKCQDKLILMGKNEESLKILNKANTLSPNDIEILEHLGVVYAKVGKFKDSINALKKALKLAEDKDHKIELKKKISDIQKQLKSPKPENQR